METLFSSISYNDPIWIATAFACGALVRPLGLPPLVGFLVAGFLLNLLGAQGGEFLHEMADLGVTLLLFTIGLKIRPAELLQRPVWFGAISHMLAFALVCLLIVWLAGRLSLFAPLEISLLTALIIAFAASFSSTVFGVKTLEATGNFRSRFGQLAVGVLIIQDLAAVIYLGISEARLPSIWALLLLLILVLGFRVLSRILDKIGHGELLVLLGLSLALGGASLFEAVDLKADLGALVFGAMLASHSKAEELAKSLLSLKDLFLVGFFLSIGMAGLPSFEAVILVGLLTLLLPIKSGLFFWLFSRTGIRVYPASRAALTLGNYSEFGLIVTSVAVAQGWVASEWLSAMAILVAVSFALSAAINHRSEILYGRFETQLKRFAPVAKRRDDSEIELGDARILLCGMGRVGRSVYDNLPCPEKVLGIDFDRDLVTARSARGYRVRYANASSVEFWSQLDLVNSEVSWIVLTTPNLQVNLAAATHARAYGFRGKISASARFSDDAETLREAGVDVVFNIYDEAGRGLAAHYAPSAQSAPGAAREPEP